MKLFMIAGLAAGLLAQSSSHSAIEQLIARYARSIDAADPALAAEVWSQSPDVSFIHPLGHEHGFAQIKQNVYLQLMGNTFSERRLTIRDIRINEFRDTAYAEFYWDFAAKLREGGTALNTKGRETQIYRKEHGAWRLVHVHYSAMPEPR